MTGLGLFAIAAAIVIHAIISSRRRAPDPPCNLSGMEIDMAVSQDVQDICDDLKTEAEETAAAIAALPGQFAAANAAAIAAGVKSGVADALVQVQQDHDDEVAALKTSIADLKNQLADALAAATPPPAAP